MRFVKNALFSVFAFKVATTQSFINYLYNAVFQANYRIITRCLTISYYVRFVTLGWMMMEAKDAQSPPPPLPEHSDLCLPRRVY